MRNTFLGSVKFTTSTHRERANSFFAFSPSLNGGRLLEREDLCPRLSVLYFIFFFRFFLLVPHLLEIVFQFLLYFFSPTSLLRSRPVENTGLKNVEAVRCIPLKKKKKETRKKDISHWKERRKRNKKRG